jgi:hypothetical protein
METRITPGRQSKKTGGGESKNTPDEYSCLSFCIHRSSSVTSPSTRSSIFVFAKISGKTRAKLTNWPASDR